MTSEGLGLQCFECKMDPKHICNSEGPQEGTNVTCKYGENACAKNVGGKTRHKPQTAILDLPNSNSIDFHLLFRFLILFRSFGRRSV